MAAWPGTKTRMTVDGAGDLRLDEGASWGTYEVASVDLAWLGAHLFDIEYEVQEDPASDNIGESKLEIDTSDDNANWDGFREFHPGEIVTRYYKLKITIHGSPAIGQRPKLTRLEPNVARSDTAPRGAAILAIQNNPPANPNVGEGWVIGTGAGAWAGKDNEEARCIETTGPTYRYCKPVQGRKLHDLNNDEDIIFDEYSEWVSCDARTTAPFRQHCKARFYDAIFPVGEGNTWGYLIDGAQDTNGYMETAGLGADADGDYITFKVGLKRGSYDLFFLTTTDGSHGIVKAYLDSTLVATWDCFDAAGLTRNVLKTQLAIAVTVAKAYTLKLIIDGQNVASGGFEFFVSAVAIAPA